MKELDFSKISTDDLREMVRDGKGNNAYCCIYCNECPFLNNGCTDDNDSNFLAFEAELKKREDKEMNKMPELKAGMIVELESLNVGYLGRYLYINDGWLIKDSTLWMNLEKSDTIITKVFTVEMNVNHTGESYNYAMNIENHKLIWSKKSDTDIKIEELSETIRKATEQIEELKKGIK